MIIFFALVLFGVGIICVSVAGIVFGIIKKSLVIAVISFLLPVAYWLGVFALLEADRRFVAEEIRKNDGRLPDWVW